MFNKILIVCSEKITEKHLNCLESVKKILSDLGKEFFVVKAKELTDSNFVFVELVITVGGDGSFIRAASFLKDIPIIGINSEPEFSEGALTSLKESELSFLYEVFSGNFKTIERVRAKVKLNGNYLKERILNEVYVGASNHFHTSRYVLDFDNFSEEQRSSGVLIATGSGSRAWYKSAGGEPFYYDEVKLKFLVREPFSGKLFFPHITSGEILKDKKISFICRRYSGGVLALDSSRVYDLHFGDIVEVELSDQPLRVIVKN